MQSYKIIHKYVYNNTYLTNNGFVAKWHIKTIYSMDIQDIFAVD